VCPLHWRLCTFLSIGYSGFNEIDSKSEQQLKHKLAISKVDQMKAMSAPAG